MTEQNQGPDQGPDQGHIGEAPANPGEHHRPINFRIDGDNVILVIDLDRTGRNPIRIDVDSGALVSEAIDLIRHGNHGLHVSSGVLGSGVLRVSLRDSTTEKEVASFQVDLVTTFQELARLV